MNTITLSTDLSTLYLIDGDRMQSFSLETENGVLIGSLGGQIVATSAMDNSADRSLGTGISIQQGSGNFLYNPETQRLTLVGTDDIEGALIDEREALDNAATRNVGTDDIEGARGTERSVEEPRPRVRSILLGQSILHIRKSGDSLQLKVIPL